MWWFICKTFQTKAMAAILQNSGKSDRGASNPKFRSFLIETIAFESYVEKLSACIKFGEIIRKYASVNIFNTLYLIFLSVSDRFEYEDIQRLIFVSSKDLSDLSQFVVFAAPHVRLAAVCCVMHLVSYSGALTSSLLNTLLSMLNIFHLKKWKEYFLK